MDKYVLPSIALSLYFLCSCSVREGRFIDGCAPIFPDYSEVTVPSNIAPVSFTIDDDRYVHQKAVFEAGNARYLVPARRGSISVPAGKWKKLKEEAAGGSVSVRLYAKEKGAGDVSFSPFSIYVSEDEIDRYVAYRLIEPGYEIWNEMGIYQRDLETFRQSAVITNKHTDHGCMNCHSFHNYNPDEMLFHLRLGYAGTYMLDGGDFVKLNTKTPETISNLVYPQWHPSGRYIAFSVNATKQMFHTSDPNRVEVFDSSSDVVIYDLESKTIFSNDALKRAGVFETFPTFSPDGKSIYFCSADSLSAPRDYDKIKYSLCRTDFNPEDGTVGTVVDTLVNARETGKSVSFPRVSPDGKMLVFTMSEYGNFSIWHQDSDLYSLDIATGEYRAMDSANSDSVDSYHSWSSNGRWLVFSSRRMDKLYTRLFIVHIDEDGNVSKPFVLPQKNVSYYRDLMKSYNIPEFIEGKVEMNQMKFHSFAKKDRGFNLTFEDRSL